MSDRGAKNAVREKPAGRAPALFPPEAGHHHGCTDNLCDIALGAPVTGCRFPNNTLGCNDGFSCTQSDACSGGACVGTPTNSLCDDGDQCTTNLCDTVNGQASTGCYFPGHTGACNDGACSIWGWCRGPS